jgi:hypothetical protein
MVLVSLFVPQCCLHSGHATEPPFTFNTLDKRAVLLCNQKWNVDINVLIFSIFFAYINLESEQNQFLNFIIIDQCYFMEFEN